MPVFMLLLKRKLFVFYAVFLVFSLFLAHPTRAHAGFFSTIVDFFLGSGDAQVVSAGRVINESRAAGIDAVIYPFSSSGGPATTSTSGELVFTEESALVGAVNPLGTMQNSSPSGQIYVYTVKPGDTALGIASSFGITLNTLLWANDVARPNTIKPGDTLIILPVSGVQYEIKKGDTIAAIAKRFGGDADDILAFNGFGPGDALDVGATIIIPDGELPVVPNTTKPTPPSSTARLYAGLPEMKGFYMRPISAGRKTRGIHGYNGVDLADRCGVPVFASAEGTIIIAKAGGWNGGYGKYIVVAHPNGTQTLYAHLQQLFVVPGTRVSQGMTIAFLGTTGNSTGCHVHFEVRGAKNPF